MEEFIKNFAVQWDGDENSLDEMVTLLDKALAYEGRARGRERIVESGLTNKQVANNIINIYKKIQINVPLYKNKE